MKSIPVCLLALALCGCISATATRTVNVAGQPVVESIKVRAFLGNIHQGVYTNGNGMALTVTDATPDQQSIALLVGGVTELAKMFAARAPTNTVSVVTNASGNIIVVPSKP